MKEDTTYYLRLELTIKAKKGIAFVLSASLIWFAITFVWLSIQDVNNLKSVWAILLIVLFFPLKYVLSKLLDTNSYINNNSLQSLGLWLNFSQLFYFPFLVFIVLNDPKYLVMAHAIIT
ncbi:MAG: hypothetical protein AAFX55_18645, partial [Bacteroidota bacterium]